MRNSPSRENQDATEERHLKTKVTMNARRTQSPSVRSGSEQVNHQQVSRCSANPRARLILAQFATVTTLVSRHIPMSFLRVLPRRVPHRSAFQCCCQFSSSSRIAAKATKPAAGKNAAAAAASIPEASADGASCCSSTVSSLLNRASLSKYHGGLCR